MTERRLSSAGAEPELVCANCGRKLDPTDKFCRDCGLPTVRRAQAQRQIPTLPPDTGELKRALDAAPDLQPFVRTEPPPEPGPAEVTTGDVVKVTSPTYAAQMATSTVIMLVVMALLAIAGIVFLILAFKV